MKLKLRKCEEHDDCQLQQIDDGDWEHTPKDTPFQERFGGSLTPAQEALLHRLTEDVRRANNTREWAEEAAMRIVMLEQVSIQTEQRLRDLEYRLDETLRLAQESVDRVSVKAQEVEALADRASKLIDKASRIEDVYKRAGELEDLVKAESHDLNLRVDKVENKTKHEREERLQATQKAQRQIQMLSERIG